MQFIKSDLKTGMFVRTRNGRFAVVMGQSISELNVWIGLQGYNNNLKHQAGAEYDIISVYEAEKPRGLDIYLKGCDLKLIWVRTEQTEAQRKMELLQARAKALQEQAQAIQEQITKLRGTLQCLDL